MSASHEDRIVYLPGAAPDSELRFHLDENVSRAVAKILRQQGFDVTTTNDVGLRSEPDDSQMAHARQEQRVLLDARSRLPRSPRLGLSAQRHYLLAARPGRDAAKKCRNCCCDS